MRDVTHNNIVIEHAAGSPSGKKKSIYRKRLRVELAGKYHKINTNSTNFGNNRKK